MSTPEPIYDAALERLYATFSCYPFNPDIHGCPCCITAEDQALLASSALRQLSASDVEKYAFKAVSTWGDVEDFKHFLPRLLDLEARGGGHFLVRIQDKLAYCAWREWPADEQAAIAEFIVSSAQSLMTIWPDKRQLIDVLDDAVSLGVDLTAFVDAWPRLRAQEAAIHQLATLVDGGFDFDNVVLSPASAAAWQQLRTWLLDPETEQCLVEAYLAGVGGKGELDRLARAADAIAARRSAT